jgi:hypothetical protein
MKISNALVAPLAAILIVTGAGAVLATTNSHPATVEAPAAAAATPAAPAATPEPPKPPKDLVTVLDQLVKDGKITPAQETMILDGLVAQKVADRAAHEALKAQLATILADGVITQAEVDSLPTGSPLKGISKFMTNGKISVTDLQALGAAVGGWHVGKGPDPKP